MPQSLSTISEFAQFSDFITYVGHKTHQRNMANCIIASDVRKQTDLCGIYNLIIEKGYSFADMVEYVERYGRWRKLLYSEWFIVTLLPYMNVNDIAKLDSTICNKKDRKQWLDCLTRCALPIELNNYVHKNLNIVMNWIVSKSIQVIELKLLLNVSKYTENILISNESMNKLTRNNPIIEKISILGDCFNMDDQCYLSIALFCHQLKSLTIERHIINTDAYAFDIKALNEILKVNQHLKYLNLSNIHLSGTTFVILGQSCPLLETLNYENKYEIISDVTDEQIESFTKGCQYLKHILIPNPSLFQFNIFFQCLGKFNPFLEKINISSIFGSPYEVITSTSLELLLN